MDSSVPELIKCLDMSPHPEGGYFKETYRSRGKIKNDSLPANFKGERNYSTSIYFLLPQGVRSHLHRLASDEIWHFYLGGPMTLVQLYSDGKVVEVTLGQDLRAGQKLQHVVPAGCWFGGYPNPGVEYSLVGCTVAPGFDFSDFQMGKRLELLKQFPHAKTLIERLTN